jgi:hypothetical protein
VTKWKGEASRNFGIYLSREKGEFCFSASFARHGSRFNDISSGLSVFDGKWHALAVTYSKYDADVRFYQDGKLIKRLAFDGGDLATNDMPVAIANGFFKTQGGKTRPVAAVRDVWIWNRALSAEEVAGIKPAIDTRK